MKTQLITILIIAIIIIYSFKSIKTRYKRQRWQKKLNLPQHQQIFNTIYQDVNGFALSKQARSANDAMEYVYGEIEFLPYIALLSLVHLDETSIFYDLGSGTGKAVIACAMVYPLKKSIGIELFSELHTCANKQKEKLLQFNDYIETADKIDFVLGNFLEVSLVDATIVFINATALFGDTWEKLCTKLDNLPTLSVVITTSKPLKSPKFVVERTTEVMMSWGSVLAFIHRKVNNH